MNYIKKLQRQNELLKLKIKMLEDGYNDVRRYLNLPKFHQDPYVNKDDIFHRFDEIRLSIDNSIDGLIENYE